MKNFISIQFLGIAALVGVTALWAGSAAPVQANHSWGGYHWARTANSFTLKLGDNVSGAWDSYLATASADWSASSILDTSIVAGSTSAKRCRPTNGRVEVCNSGYGKTGWLGVAQIWISGSHITQGAVKMNDTYFNTATYNTPAWRNLVLCQEIGHTFGLDHQDEIFGNTNLGTCMDYTSDPSGALYGQLSNEHPNAHDYNQLSAIYSHLDTLTTAFSGTSGLPAVANEEAQDGPAAWGKEVRKSGDGKNSLFVRDLGKGEQVFTFVIWADGE
jgi:hypothetical protein